MAGVGIRFTGIAQMEARTMRARNAAVRELSAALREVQMVVFERSQELVPYLRTDLQARFPDLTPGVLKESGFLGRPSFQGFDKVELAITYGASGDASNYALLQHEELRFMHDPGKQAKYLEMPALQSIPMIQERMSAHLSQIFAV